METCMAKVNLFKLTEQSMKENFRMIKDMVVEYLLSQMGKDLKVNLRIIKNMDSVLNIILMVINMMVNGEIIALMEKEFIIVT